MVGIERKYMARLDWRRIKRRRCTYMMIEEGCFAGAIGLMLFDEISMPLDKTCAGKTARIVEQGGAWLQLAPVAGHYWATAMFDRAGELTQIYCDVTAQTCVLPDGESWFDDLMLDVVLNSSGDIEVMDRDELDAALHRQIITPEQHADALSTADMIVGYMREHMPELLSICRRYYSELMRQL